ncbi:MAG TPA: glycoside hydrolase family 9 protein [Chitinophagaceae bacterium]
MKRLLFLLLCMMSVYAYAQEIIPSWIRINQLGYLPTSKKIAVWGSFGEDTITTFRLVDSATNKTVYTGKAGRAFGAYGPFKQTQRLDFSAFKKEGKYFLLAGNALSKKFVINKDAYKGTADFCLRYMRQQRTGFNPFLKDSCHQYDGYTVYGPMRDSTHIDVVGGWHDASDYLQYVPTSANATYHLLMAYRDFKDVFTDKHAANGLEGSNGVKDVLDEAKWGLDWLLKMHPREDWMFNQIADDRDHISMRRPKLDSQYNKGYERPVYFINGEPQGLFQYKNRTKGTSSSAAKFSSAFALGYTLFADRDATYAKKLFDRMGTALTYANQKPGVTQTAPGRAPYFYEEDNWVDDMELAYAAGAAAMNTFNKTNKTGFQHQPVQVPLANALMYASKEPHTPWLGADTAKHYQWYPFINLGHYELAKQLKGAQRDTVVRYYREGIQKVWNKAKANAFYRGVPFIWCSNNLTTSFAMQCYWYKQLTGDKQFEELAQANFDWLFGVNPWGTSMVYGLPSWGDTPVDPHSWFTHSGKYPIDGGLVDGPVYGSIFGNLKGITLYNKDAYEQFQSQLAVYHDDYGDYSTNEPTMDGTASLVYLLAAKEAEGRPAPAKKK